jgi:DUF1016 N-terminal domain
MTKPPRKKPAKVGAKKVPPPVKQSPAQADAVVATPRRQSAAFAGTRDLAALVERVVAIVEEARARVVRTVNSEMVLSYWHIGREIVEYVQRGEARAEYGKEVIEELSQHLQERIGRGYSTTNLRYFRAFYIAYCDRSPEIRHVGSGESERGAGATTPRKIRHKGGGASLGELNPAPLNGFSPLLGWSHYRALMKLEPATVRTFYEIEAERGNWPVEHLERQIFTLLHLRLLKSRDKDGVMELARKGQTVERPADLMKSPVVLDFLVLRAEPRCARRTSRAPSSASCRSSSWSWARASRSWRVRSASRSRIRTSSSTSSSTTSSSSATCSSTSSSASSRTRTSDRWTVTSASSTRRAARRVTGPPSVSSFAPRRTRSLHDGHRAYLPWHRERVFKDARDGGAR